MKIDYNSNAESERSWEVGDVIHNSISSDNDFYLVSEVNTDGESLYTLVNLESGCTLECTKTIRELQQAFHDKHDKILKGTFKYMDDDK